MGRYEGHTKNENRPEAADKKRLADLAGIEPATSFMLLFRLLIAPPGFQLDHRQAGQDSAFGPPGVASRHKNRVLSG